MKWPHFSYTKYRTFVKANFQALQNCRGCNVSLEFSLAQLVQMVCKIPWLFLFTYFERRQHRAHVKVTFHYQRSELNLDACNFRYYVHSILCVQNHNLTFTFGNFSRICTFLFFRLLSVIDTCQNYVLGVHN